MMNEFSLLLLTTILYVVIGLLFFALSVFVVEKATHWSLHKEILDDENIAVGIMFGAIFLGIAIIIAAAIHG